MRGENRDDRRTFRTIKKNVASNENEYHIRIRISKGKQGITEENDVLH